MLYTAAPCLLWCIKVLHQVNLNQTKKMENQKCFIHFLLAHFHKLYPLCTLFKMYTVATKLFIKYCLLFGIAIQLLNSCPFIIQWGEWNISSTPRDMNAKEEVALEKTRGKE